MAQTKDIVVTWPKSRSLEDYLASLDGAMRAGLDINFRVPQLPAVDPERCYRVHDGAVRGYTSVLACVERGEREVQRVISDGEESFWPAGKYIVCSPIWYPLADPISMRGFQGWRYMDWGR